MEMKILKLATDVRVQMETDILANDDTGQFENVNRITAVGLCDIYAEEITDLLIAHGITAKRVEGQFSGKHHFWTETETGLVVDITADQFGEHLPKVLLGTYSEFPQYTK